MNRLKLIGIAMVLLQSFIYGLPDSYVKLVYMEFPVMSFLGARYIVASTFMLLVWGKTIIAEVKRTNIRSYILPVLCMGVAFLISNSALKYTTVSNVAFVRSSTPIIAAIMLMMFFDRKITLKDSVPLTVLVGGMYCIATQHGEAFSKGFGMGEALSLLSSCTMAGALVFGKNTLNYISPYTLTCLQCIASFSFCVLVGFVDGTLLTTPWELMGKNYILLSMLYLALFCSVGGLLLQNYALKFINSKLCSILQCMYPIVASVIAFFVLGESPTIIGIIGFALVILAVVLECFNRE